jgi:uncharacterized membrane protein
MSDEEKIFIQTKRSNFASKLRNNFLTGLAVIIPVFITTYLIWSTIGLVDGWVLPLIPEKYTIDKFIGIDIKGIGVVIFLLFTVLIGSLTKGYVGRTILKSAESLVDRMPVVRSIYNGIKQIAETIFNQSNNSFERACLVEYPRKGIWAVAFVSTKTKGEVTTKLGKNKDLYSIFLPTTPNPTSGFLLFLPEKDIVFLDMSVEDAAKLVISAGLVTPKNILSAKTNKKIKNKKNN